MRMIVIIDHVIGVTSVPTVVWCYFIAERKTKIAPFSLLKLVCIAFLLF